MTQQTPLPFPDGSTPPESGTPTSDPTTAPVEASTPAAGDAVDPDQPELPMPGATPGESVLDPPPPPPRPRPVDTASRPLWARVLGRVLSPWVALKIEPAAPA